MRRPVRPYGQLLGRSPWRRRRKEAAEAPVRRTVGADVDQNAATVSGLAACFFFSAGRGCSVSRSRSRCGGPEAETLADPSSRAAATLALGRGERPGSEGGHGVTPRRRSAGRAPPPRRPIARPHFAGGRARPWRRSDNSPTGSDDQHARRRRRSDRRSSVSFATSRRPWRWLTDVRSRLPFAGVRRWRVARSATFVLFGHGRGSRSLAARCLIRAAEARRCRAKSILVSAARARNGRRENDACIS